jgi:hypothetical protein
LYCDEYCQHKNDISSIKPGILWKLLWWLQFNIQLASKLIIFTHEMLSTTLNIFLIFSYIHSHSKTKENFPLFFFVCKKWTCSSAITVLRTMLSAFVIFNATKYRLHGKGIRHQYFMSKNTHIYKLKMNELTTWHFALCCYILFL